MGFLLPSFAPVTSGVTEDLPNEVRSNYPDQTNLTRPLFANKYPIKLQEITLGKLMAIEVSYFILPGITEQVAVLPEDIKPGTGGDLTFNTNSGGLVDEVKISKETVACTLKGISLATFTELRTLRNTTIAGRVAGTVQASDLNFGGYILEQAILSAVALQKFVTVAGVTIIDCEVTYNSLVYS